SACNTTLSSGLSAHPRRHPGWHPAAWRLVALLTQLSCSALHCSRDDRVGVHLVSRRRLHPGADGVRYCCQSETQALVDARRCAGAPEEVYSPSARTFPPDAGASFAEGPASAGCVSAKARGSSRGAPGPEFFRNRNVFSGPGWVPASASGDCRVLSHCTRDSMLHCTNIRYGGGPKGIGADFPDLSCTGALALGRRVHAICSS